MNLDDAAKEILAQDARRELILDRQIAAARLDAARKVRDAIARLWPGLEADEIMTDAALRRIVEAGE